jgi:hypothetical protein
LCSIEECGRKVKARGYCMKHYLRAHKQGFEALEPRKCPNCMASFVPKIERNLFCSRDCRLAARPRAHKLRWASCEICSAGFVGQPSGSARFCGADCRRVHLAAKARDEQAAYRAAHGESRARKFERARKQRIFDRDGWVCQLCGDPIPEDARRPDPLAAEVDHCVPVALGGSDDPSNLQAAHARCNRVKGDRFVSPLAVVA